MRNLFLFVRGEDDILSSCQLVNGHDPFIGKFFPVFNSNEPKDLWKEVGHLQRKYEGCIAFPLIHDVNPGGFSLAV
jgi:hypothetical protein